MIGAPMLAARAAYRAGCGLVRVAMPGPVLASALTLLPEAVGLCLELDSDDADRLRPAADAADALVVGPGLGQEPDADSLLDAMLDAKKPTVLDADALNLLAARPGKPVFDAPTVLTPHPGEMRRLLRHVPGHDSVPADDAGREVLARAAARHWKATVVLKGRRSVVASGDEVRLNTTGDVTLAKAGTGDVLAGTIGSLLAQGMSAHDAAVLGVHVHGLAGERVGRATTRCGALAHEVADEVARVIEAFALAG
jgi:NAD(P)H-hydrate epimerase